MKGPENESGSAVLQRLDEQLSKYRFMDANLQQKKKRLAVHQHGMEITASNFVHILYSIMLYKVVCLNIVSIEMLKILLCAVG